MNRDMVCISCPLGCRLSVTGSEEDLHISGNKCARGEVYAREEILSPKRVVTATVRLLNRQDLARLPVKTSAAVPKEHIAPLLNQLYALEVSSPVETGAVVLKDYLGLGIDVLATRSL